MISQTTLPVKKACKAFEISRQGFYDWKKRRPPENTDTKILPLIEEIAVEFPKYGYRRVTKQLHRKGVQINHKRIHRIMKEIICSFAERNSTQ